MIDFIKKYAVQLADPHGLEMIGAEMARQDQDIADTLSTQKEAIRALAEDIRRTVKVLLLGMGASQLVNEVFALQLRKFRIDAFALRNSSTIPYLRMGIR